MSRRASRVDSNHAEIVHALRQLGATVQSLAKVGSDCPDLAVGYGGRTFLIEVKSGKGKLTPGQAQWIDAWKGHACVVRSVAEALLAVMSPERTSVR